MPKPSIARSQPDLSGTAPPPRKAGTTILRHVFQFEKNVRSSMLSVCASLGEPIKSSCPSPSGATMSSATIWPIVRPSGSARRTISLTIQPRVMAWYSLQPLRSGSFARSATSRDSFGKAGRSAAIAPEAEPPRMRSVVRSLARRLKRVRPASCRMTCATVVPALPFCAYSGQSSATSWS